MSTDKIFCGSAKVVETQFGELTKLSFNEDDLKTLQENLKNGWVNCVVKKKREAAEGKPTHYIEVDTWQPNNVQQPNQLTEELDPDDLPF